MKNVSLEYFIEQEKEGVIFAKITKSKDVGNVHGTFYDYSKYVGKYIDKTVDPNFEQSTIEPIDVAYGYFHYGDQLTVINFTKILEWKNVNDFRATEGIKKYCFDVNMVYIEEVMSLNEPATIDYLLSHVSKDVVENMSNCAISNLKNTGCNMGADYLRMQRDKMLGLKGKIVEEEITNPSSTFWDKIRGFFRKYYLL